MENESPVGPQGMILDSARRNSCIRSLDEVLPNTFSGEPAAHHEVALTFSPAPNLREKDDTPGTHTHLPLRCEVKSLVVLPADASHRGHTGGLF